jgi:dihydroceramidase
METTLRSSLKPKIRPDGSLVLASVLEEEARMDARDMVILRTMWKMIACGLSAVAGGFLIWINRDSSCRYSHKVTTWTQL